MRHRPLALLLAARLAALAGPATAVTLDWVFVGNAGNADDSDTNTDNCGPDANLPCGSVPYDYYISKYEVTNAQYVEFLNAKAASDPLGLYNPSMSESVSGRITQSGISGSYTYTAKPGFENTPVNYVSFYDALRFANWLHNGQGIGDTETGAYTITADGIASNTITRNEEATVLLASENEWYKSAYYDPALPAYYDYPAGTDTPIVCSAPTSTANRANCGQIGGPDPFAALLTTDVGVYTGSASPYGTFDQGGNVREWNEQTKGGACPACGRGARGGSWFSFADSLRASYPPGSILDPASEFGDLGFRLATLVPEPAHMLLLLTGGLVLAATRRKRRA